MSQPDPVQARRDDPPDWRLSAACRGADPDLFFPKERAGKAHAQNERAKAVCQGCEVIGPCLAEALSYRAKDDQGVRGGTTENERARMRRTRTGGRVR